MPRSALPFLAALAIVLAAGCATSRVDPISPDIHGIQVNRAATVGGDYYFFERRAPDTRKWYEARELIPGFGQMIYTEEGERQLRRDRWTPK